MKAFTIHDDIGLIDLLLLERETVERSTWDCYHVGVEGAGAANLNTGGFPQDRRSMSGVELLQRASVIEVLEGGDFSGCLEGAVMPWLTIRSIRGMYFVVITNLDSFVITLHNHFQDVRESPEDIGYVA